VIYLGLFMVSVFIYFATAIAGQMQFEGRPLERGVGVVESKRVEGDRYLLDIRVPLGAKHTGVGEGSLDQEAWDLFSPGDGVGVLYRTNRSRRELKIEEVGLQPVTVPGTLPSVILPPPKASP
jgi:hypothetical protein